MLYLLMILLSPGLLITGGALAILVITLSVWVWIACLAGALRALERAVYPMRVGRR